MNETQQIKQKNNNSLNIKEDKKWLPAIKPSSSREKIKPAQTNNFPTSHRRSNANKNGQLGARSLSPSSELDPATRKLCRDFCRLNGIHKSDRKQFMDKVTFGVDIEVAMKQTLAKRARIDEHDKNVTRENIHITSYCVRHQIKGDDKCWFKEFIRQGFEPEEARHKVFERRLEMLNWKKASKSDDQQGNFSASNFATQQQESCTKSINNPLRVAALAKDYPLQKLTRREVRELEEAIIEEVARGWEINLQFNGIKLGKGMLLIECKNSETVEWLFYVVPHLNAWNGVELAACLEDDLPLPHSITLYLPNSAKQDYKTTMALLALKNRGLNIESWQIVNGRNKGTEQVITLGVDEATITLLRSLQNKLRYGFETLFVQRNA